jgi:uncharacterized cupin superfamily protein
VSGYVRAAHEGDAYDWRGARVVIKASGVETFGQLAVMESTYPPGLSVPAHFHAGEDEMLHLLDGELQGFCDDCCATLKITTGAAFTMPTKIPANRTAGSVKCRPSSARRRARPVVCAPQRASPTQRGCT